MAFYVKVKNRSAHNQLHSVKSKYNLYFTSDLGVVNANDVVDIMVASEDVRF